MSPSLFDPERRRRKANITTTSSRVKRCQASRRSLIKQLSRSNLSVFFFSSILKFEVSQYNGTCNCKY
eukprot:scaffold3852_cov71-Cyclotella_meneghiniana.AAC.2